MPWDICRRTYFLAELTSILAIFCSVDACFLEFRIVGLLIGVCNPVFGVATLEVCASNSSATALTTKHRESEQAHNCNFYNYCD